MNQNSKAYLEDRPPFLELLLLMSPQAYATDTAPPNQEDLLPTSSKKNEKYLDPQGSFTTNFGFPSPGGPLGIGPYPLGLYGNDPWLTSLILSSLLPDPGLGLGYGGFPYNYSPYWGPLNKRDPIVGLLLRQYGKYLPYGLGRYGLYGYSAIDTVHDNKEIGAYKYEYRL
ncbi:hypothetical protein C0J52_22978 [Blattella germanica]|nr:hypothetical protein C0J52_22978 [Blattella germanica]